MRIALFTECYRPIVNGVVVSVLTFTGELAKRGHEVQIVAPGFPGYRDNEPNIYRLASVSLPFRPRYPVALPFSSFRLGRIFDEHPPDIVHVQHPFMACREGRRWARRLDRPLVLTYHTLIRSYAHYVPLPRAWVRAAAVWISREFANSADCVIVPTRTVERILRSYDIQSPIHVVPTGIDLDLINSAQRGGARASYGIPETAPLVTYSGRLAREKSLDVILRAFARLSRRLPEAYLLLVGDGPWLQQCRRDARALGVADRVRVTGYVARSRVFDCLADSDAFVFASLTDTQGVAVLEAMALGCPPVAVQSGAVDDIVRDGTDGLLVPPDPDALGEGLARVLESPQLRESLAGQARRRAEQFTAGRMAERLINVYRGLLSS